MRLENPPAVLALEVNLHFVQVVHIRICILRVGHTYMVALH